MVQHSYTRSIPLLYYPESYCPQLSPFYNLDCFRKFDYFRKSATCSGNRHADKIRVTRNDELLIGEADNSTF